MLPKGLDDINQCEKAVTRFNFVKGIAAHLQHI
jgi:hypothetical protein